MGKFLFQVCTEIATAVIYVNSDLHNRPVYMYLTGQTKEEPFGPGEVGMEGWLATHPYGRRRAGGPD